jgi:hypothetical protein
MWYLLIFALLSPILVVGAVFIGTIAITLWQAFKINFWIALWVTIVGLYLIL